MGMPKNKEEFWAENNTNKPREARYGSYCFPEIFQFGMYRWVRKDMVSVKGLE